MTTEHMARIESKCFHLQSTNAYAPHPSEALSDALDMAQEGFQKAIKYRAMAEDAQELIREWIASPTLEAAKAIAGWYRTNAADLNPLMPILDVDLDHHP